MKRLTTLLVALVLVAVALVPGASAQGPDQWPASLPDHFQRGSYKHRGLSHYGDCSSVWERDSTVCDLIVVQGTRHETALTVHQGAVQLDIVRVTRLRHEVHVRLKSPPRVTERRCVAHCSGDGWPQYANVQGPARLPDGRRDAGGNCDSPQRGLAGPRYDPAEYGMAGVSFAVNHRGIWVVPATCLAPGVHEFRYERVDVVTNGVKAAHSANWLMMSLSACHLQTGHCITSAYYGAGAPQVGDGVIEDVGWTGPTRVTAWWDFRDGPPGCRGCWATDYLSKIVDMD